MYLIREVMHCKPGKVTPLVKKFKGLAKVMRKMGYDSPFRILTDVSGERYWTMVAEQEVESLEEYAKMSRKTMSDKRLQKAMKNYHDLVDSGHREIYKIE
jgi:hypothetical protein